MKDNTIVWIGLIIIIITIIVGSVVVIIVQTNAINNCEKIKGCDKHLCLSDAGIGIIHTIESKIDYQNCLLKSNLKEVKICQKVNHVTV